ncbi:unnamed protein product, partial [Rotaria socialis]
LERQNRKPVSTNENSPQYDGVHSTPTLTPSLSSSSLSSSTSNSESINVKLEQNRVEQLRLIDDMKEMVLKTCVPALDHVRKQAATTTGNA